MNAIHMRRFRNIPPLQYLLGFEAAARLESFSKAAEELGLSASAISHEMRLLEERLGQPLFIRQGRAIWLTDAGRDYQRTVMHSLEQLEGGFRRLEPYRKPGSVVIYCETDFASRWLLPRLDDLKRAVPACEPWIDTSGKAIDFESLEVSIAIVRGRATASSSLTQDLFEDVLVPVASSNLIRKMLPKPEQLLKHPLIHDERPEGWNEWFEAVGIKDADSSIGLDFSEREMALGAAEAGHGVALCTAAFIGARSKGSRLTKACGGELDTGHVWRAQTTEKELSDNATSQVWKWLCGKSLKSSRVGT
jgi:LysR family transcriptional regulator, glycine cleavage system transcriptional activator